ncbi:hypothetical protein BCD49_37475 [Pseudofrankia sp. EUN1h]|nr:hypothetical protein BCD49_37475 [Pseudofrankia sp. EUN1h]
MISVERYGPWALVTGGSEGLGASFARQLGAAGLNLILLARREGPLERTAAEIRAECGVEVRTLSVDISAPDLLDHIRKVSDDVAVGLLVSNIGGYFGSGPFLGLDADDVRRNVRSSPLAHATLAHHFGARMLPRGRGGIILVGSLAGSAGGPARAMYSAGKAFTQILAEGLWTEAGPDGLDVAYLVVGSTDTPARALAAGPVTEGQVVDDPDDIATFALANITDGPVLVPPRLLPAFTELAAMPRRQAAETMRAMFGGQRAN